MDNFDGFFGDKFISRVEAKSIWEAAETSRDGGIVALLLGAGLRRSEALSMIPKDILFEEGDHDA